MKYGRRWPLRPLLRGNIEIYDCHTNCSNDNNKVLLNKMSFQTKGQKPASKCSHDFSIIGSNSFPTEVGPWVLNGQKTSCQTLTQLYWQPWILYSLFPPCWNSLSQRITFLRKNCEPYQQESQPNYLQTNRWFFLIQLQTCLRCRIASPCSIDIKWPTCSQRGTWRQFKDFFHPAQRAVEDMHLIYLNLTYAEVTC